ncbi:MAG: efflux RND transporter periplasmic adaptor subunit [Planctomycetes bacterium]|nr:efflux RND transporter periplasmic adaptor subunit [Planctomycetota bacterium]
MRPVRMLFIIGGLFFGLLLFVAVLLMVARMDLVVVGQGTIEEHSWRYITPEVKGIVSEVLKKEGDAVEEGEVIALLDDCEARELLRKAELAFSEAEKAVAVAVQEHAHLVENRKFVAMELELFSIEQDKARLRLDAAVADRRGAEAGVAKTEKSVAAARIRLGSAVLEREDQERLAKAGFVSDRFVERARNAEQLASLAVESAMSDLVSARQDLERMRSNEALRKAELDGLSAATLQANLEFVDHEVKAAQARIEQAEVRRDSAAAELDRMRYRSGLYKIRAPIAGTIVDLDLYSGEMSGTTAAGAATSVVGKVVGEGGFDMVAAVPKLEVIRVRPEQEVDVRMDAYGYRRYGTFRGVVASIKAEDDGTYKVRIRLDRSIYELRSGMGGLARIKVGRVNVLSYIMGLAEDKDLERLRKEADRVGSATYPPGEGPEPDAGE